MSDFDTGTCATAIAATVAVPSQSAPALTSPPARSEPIMEATALGDESDELLGPLSAAWQSLIHPLLRALDQHLDCRLVHTLERTVLSIFRHRHRHCGLLLSELGAFICGESHAPAGTKRLSNLLRSPRWESSAIADYLWANAVQRWTDLVYNHQDVLLLWDESVVEKPESIESEGLSPVRSSKAKRLSRIKPGYYRPPGPPVFVPGLNWLALLLIGRSGPPTVVAMEWWGTRKASPHSPSSAHDETPAPQSVTGAETATLESVAAEPSWFSSRQEVIHRLLKKCSCEFGYGVIHIFDRGYSGGPWLESLHEHDVRFIMRWNKRYQLDKVSGGKLAAWKLFRGKRNMDSRMIKDGPRKRERRMGIVYTQVAHPSYGDTIHPLWLVASRPGKGLEPWYLLTNEPIACPQDAWDIVFAYARRWQIEGCFRFNKTELAMESPRLWTWERRLKLLMIATLAYALFLNIVEMPQEWKQTLLNQWCHRTGKRSRETPTPLYRLRIALAALLNERHSELRLYESSG